MKSSAKKSADQHDDLDGIGTPIVRTKLSRLGISRAQDLLLFFPLRYEDETQVFGISEAPERDLVQIEVTVVQAKVEFRPGRQLVVTVEDESDRAILRFLHFYPNQQRVLEVGARIRVVGELRMGRQRLREMVHPRVKKIIENDPLPTTLTPVYPTTKGLSQAAIRKAVAQAFTIVDQSDTLLPSILKDLGLPSYSKTVNMLHRPTPDVDAAVLKDSLGIFWGRISFDELFAQQLIMRKNYDKREQYSAPLMKRNTIEMKKFLDHLNFKLTSAQNRVLVEIQTDMADRVPMRRLLQGDVGSGKTVIAALAALQVIGSGYQVALMVPTEILSEQHFKKIEEWLAVLGITVERLTGSLTKKERAIVIEKIASGSAKLIVGTHALFQGDVVFKNLGLVIIDEQHRFGVKQRLALVDKGADRLNQTHQLMMSATPIPRSLAMSFFGDLDVSAIDELPPDRVPITTKLVSNSRREEVFQRVQETCRSGQQVYWVCPLIEESEVLQLETAIQTHQTIQAQFPNLSIGIVHGRMKAQDKTAVMEKFSNREIHLLVATTVIEVGVDVPNATVMVIESAERMGLSQLHQLRGRIGRGAYASTCILLYGQKLTDIARARLKIIYENIDGFEVAQADLQLRGPGEILGARQSGMPMLRYADIERDLLFLEAAKRLAPDFLAHHPNLAERHINRWYGSREKYSEV
ncbi:MAG: ATP-dependent DNA helicase RecG [Proteobacteria bacterium]|nr:ATP-dependent DNA helicase RecG [Pseudomonadota bacterium]MDA1332384.1 ATP-dependent DNA helicase RecG [Pseudomonadota bacterium]